ncbi:MAG: hypothetical protein M0R51_11640 [Clostridia bacterium]|jgi:hypothetical protein|nr:hypothetical protein [Clostridia bacterium]
MNNVIYGLIVVAFGICIFSFYGIKYIVNTKRELKEENSTFKDKNFKRFFSHIYSFDRKVENLVSFFITNPDKIKILDDYYIAFYKNNKVLLVWIENKYYSYAGIVSLCNSDSVNDQLCPICKYDEVRPSYKTMKRIAEIEQSLNRIGPYVAVKK